MVGRSLARLVLVAVMLPIAYALAGDAGKPKRLSARIADLEAKVAALEQSNAVISEAAQTALAIMKPLQARFEGVRDDVIRTTRLEIHDADGNGRAWFGTDDEGTTVLKILDTTGKIRVVLGVQQGVEPGYELPGFYLQGRDGRGIAMEVGSDRSQIEIHGKGVGVLASLTGANASAALSVLDRESKKMAMVTPLADTGIFTIPPEAFDEFLGETGGSPAGASQPVSEQPAKQEGAQSRAMPGDSSPAFAHKNVSGRPGPVEPMSTVIGEVTNGSGRSYRYVSFTLSIYDSTGGLWDAELLTVDNFAAGQTKSFNVKFDRPLPDGWRYKIDMDNAYEH